MTMSVHKYLVLSFCSGLRQGVGSNWKQFLRANLLDQLQTSLANQDLSLTKRTAHGLKGLCMQFGATHGMELARLLELDVDNIDDAKTVLAKQVEEVGRVEKFIASRKG